MNRKGWANLPSDMTRQVWAGVMRALGAANLVIAGLSLLLLLRTMHQWSAPFPGAPPAGFDAVRWSVWIVNLVFLGIFVVAGVDLLRLKLSAIRALNTLFATEVAFLAAYVFVTFVIGAWSVETEFYLAAAWLLLNFAIAAQILSGYAVVAVILLNVASKKLA